MDKILAAQIGLVGQKLKDIVGQKLVGQKLKDIMMRGWGSGDTLRKSWGE